MKKSPECPISRTERDASYYKAVQRAMCIISSTFSMRPFPVSSTASSMLESSPNESMIEIYEFHLDGILYKFKSGVQISINYDPESKMYVATNQMYGIDVYSKHIDDLKEIINEQLCFLWETYATASVNELGTKAKQIAFYLKRDITTQVGKNVQESTKD